MFPGGPVFPLTFPDNQPIDCSETGQYISFFYLFFSSYAWNENIQSEKGSLKQHHYI